MTYFTVQNPSQFSNFIENLIQKTQFKIHAPFPIFLLKGDLGLGKTTFVSYLVRFLKLNFLVTSPSYQLLNCYDFVYHMDLYRIRSIEELENDGLTENLDDRQILWLIEWPELIEKELIQLYPCITLQFSLGQNNERFIHVSENL